MKKKKRERDKAKAKEKEQERDRGERERERERETFPKAPGKPSTLLGDNAGQSSVDAQTLIREPKGTAHLPLPIPRKPETLHYRMVSRV